VRKTNSVEDENISSADRGGFRCVETRFLCVLPTPRDDVSLDDILELKCRGEAELLLGHEWMNSS
jgi:hypothetical protein